MRRTKREEEPLALFEYGELNASMKTVFVYDIPTPNPLSLNGPQVQ